MSMRAMVPLTTIGQLLAKASASSARQQASEDRTPGMSNTAANKTSREALIVGGTPARGRAGSRRLTKAGLAQTAGEAVGEDSQLISKPGRSSSSGLVR